jgi:oligoribonuclease NrnB/cAMP/cGMP phosphodiesterase (DHH superfamily)
MIIFHHNDADGRCAAAVAWRFYHCDPNIIFIEMDYNKVVPIDTIHNNEPIMIVDFSFKPEVMAEILLKTQDITWIDHHATAKAYSYGENMKGLRDFKDKGPSGCELAWKYYFPDKPLPIGVGLIGDYDSWRLTEIPETFQFYEGLKLSDQNPQSDIWDVVFVDTDVRINHIIEQGKAAIAYRDNYCGDMLKNYGYKTMIDGQEAFACNIFRFGSHGFVHEWGKHPICIAYIHDGSKFVISLYSETVDVSTIAKAHGGGGHKGAAGFTCNTLPFSRI